MITPRLEKAILSGWATYQKYNHAFGSFGSVAIPKGHLAIIVDVKWNHFFNSFQFENEGLTTLKELLRYSEYTLKLDCKKSKNYLIFKNQIKFMITNPTVSIDLDGTLASQADNIKKFFFPQHPQPIQQDVFFVCEEYINLTITRNEYINNRTTDYQALNPVANQPNIPEGIGGMNVLTTMNSNSIGGSTMQYSPPLYKNAKPNTLGTLNQTRETYTHAYDKQSMMSNPKGNGDYLYFQYPLVELGVVTFNSNFFDKIMNQ